MSEEGERQLRVPRLRPAKCDAAGLRSGRHFREVALLSGGSMIRKTFFGGAEYDAN